MKLFALKTRFGKMSKSFLKRLDMYVHISGSDQFTIYIRSYGESNYDCTLAFNPDVDMS